MNIRKAKFNHLKAIEDLNNKYFHENRDFREIIENNNSCFLVAEEKNKIIGFSGIRVFR